MHGAWRAVVSWNIRRVTVIFQQLTVLVDSLAPDGGAFAQTLDWAVRLRLPVRGMLSRGEGLTREPACAAACSRRQLEWQAAVLPENNAGLRTKSDDLLVFGQALSEERKRGLLHGAWGKDMPPMLVCPDRGSAISRVLLVDRAGQAEAGYLDAAIEICRRLHAAPVILTLARTERAVRRCQRQTQAELARLGADAELDAAIGAEIRQAVASVARWRRCHLVIADHPGNLPWWRWSRNQFVDGLLEVARSLAFLALPGGGRERDRSASPLPACSPKEEASHAALAHEGGRDFP